MGLVFEIDKEVVWLREARRLLGLDNVRLSSDQVRQILLYDYGVERREYEQDNSSPSTNRFRNNAASHLTGERREEACALLMILNDLEHAQMCYRVRMDRAMQN